MAHLLRSTQTGSVFMASRGFSSAQESGLGFLADLAGVGTTGAPTGTAMMWTSTITTSFPTARHSVTVVTEASITEASAIQEDFLMADPIPADLPTPAARRQRTPARSAASITEAPPAALPAVVARALPTAEASMAAEASMVAAAAAMVAAATGRHEPGTTTNIRSTDSCTS